jgi:AcrR family transcriptional regulator
MPRAKTSIGDVREACVREAFAIIGESGLEALSLRDVARRLGVSHQAPYKHFASRDHLLAVLVGRAFDEFAAHLDARARSDDPWIDFFHMGQAYLAFARARPLYYRLMFGATLPNPAQHPEMVRSAQHALAMLRGGVVALPGRVAGAAADLDALFAWSAVHGLATLLETPACRSAGLTASVLEDAGVHTLMRIGRAFGQGGGSAGGDHDANH